MYLYSAQVVFASLEINGAGISHCSHTERYFYGGVKFTLAGSGTGRLPGAREEANPGLFMNLA